MKLSTRTRYGTRMMIHLGLCYGKDPVLLRDIAKEEGISEKYLSQIIIALKSAGFVNSFRGAHGGYALSRSPSQITIESIVEVLEGKIDLAGEAKSPEEYSRASACVTRNLWGELSRKISETLKKITLSDLIKQHEESQVTGVMYNI
ncbi:MAG: Rrf2 family transcriptional regulator [Candidatus Omnitrophota bacterium]